MIKERVQNFHHIVIGLPAFIWQALFFIAPLVLILGVALSGIFSYMSPFFSLVYFSVILRSLITAAITTAICLAISYPLTYILVFKAGRFRIPGLFLLIVPFWTNFLLHVYAWYFVLDRGGVLNNALRYFGVISQPLEILHTPLAVIIMMVYYYLPFMILPLYAQLEKFDSNLFDASLDLGASWWQTVRRVLIPQTMPGIMTGFFLVFVPAFGEFAIPELMGGDRHLYVGTLISHLVLGIETMQYGAAFTLISCGVLLCVAAGIHFAMRHIERTW